MKAPKSQKRIRFARFVFAPILSILLPLTSALGQDNERLGTSSNRIRTAKDEALYALGKTQYEKFCVACHQEHGKGQEMIAPPLAGSNWVAGDPNPLIAIVLDGLIGPVRVSGRVYKVPEIQPLMPGLRPNPELTDEGIAAVLTYVRNTWGNRAKPVRSKDVARLREKTSDRHAPYTEAELNQL